MLALADGLGVKRFAVMGVSGGGPYVAACAARIPGERLVACLHIAGIAPLDAAPGLRDGMMKNNIIFHEAEVAVQCVSKVRAP